MFRRSRQVPVGPQVYMEHAGTEDLSVIPLGSLINAGALCLDKGVRDPCHTCHGRGISIPVTAQGEMRGGIHLAV